MRMQPGLHTNGPIRAKGDNYDATEGHGAFTAVSLIDDGGPLGAWTLYVDSPEILIELGNAIEREGRRLSAEAMERDRIQAIAVKAGDPEHTACDHPGADCVYAREGKAAFTEEVRAAEAAAAETTNDWVRLGSDQHESA